MTTRKRTRTLNEEQRAFNASWEAAYFVEEVGKNTVCMICSDSIPTKSYNVKRHYETKHMAQYGELTIEQRNKKVASLKAARQRQRFCLTRPSDDQVKTTEVSYGIAFILAKLGELLIPWPLSIIEEFIFKTALLKSVSLVKLRLPGRAPANDDYVADIQSVMGPIPYYVLVSSFMHRTHAHTHTLTH